MGLFDVIDSIFGTDSADAYNATKDIQEMQERQRQEQARKTRAKAIRKEFLPDSEYSMYDLENCVIHYAEVLNKGEEFSNFEEPDFNKFEKLIDRFIVRNEEFEYKSWLWRIYRIFLYNFCPDFPYRINWWDKANMEEQLAYS